MEFCSKRLLFREFLKADYPLFRSVFSNKAVMEYAYWDCMTEEGELESVFNGMLENNGEVNQRKSFEFALFRQSDHVYIGMAVVIMKYQKDRAVWGEIGYFLLPDFWRMGYATEIAGSLLELCFLVLGIHKAVASCNANNHPSERVMQKAGMQLEGRMRKERFKNGQWEDELRYGILLEEWETQRGK